MGKRIRTEEHWKRALQKEALKREAKLVQEVEEAARAAAKELFEKSAEEKKSGEEQKLVEDIGVAAAVAQLTKYEIAEENELKEKLKATGKEAALSEYNKLKAAREVNAERDKNKDSEQLEEATRKAATEAVESESKGKLDGIQSEEDKAQVNETLKAEVEKSGIEAATAEVDSFKVEEDLDRSEEEIMEERRAMEEAGRLAAEEEFFKLSRREEESRVAADDLAERQARAIELVKTAACDAAKDIFEASIVDPDGSDADPESPGVRSESGIH